MLWALNLPLVSGEEERLPVLSLYTLGLKGAFKVGRVVLGLSLSFRATKTEQKAARSPMGTPWPVPAWECLAGVKESWQSLPSSFSSVRDSN